MELMIVGVAAVLTSILSAVAGLGGGVILLLVIAQFTAPTAAIPIQGAIQLVANSSRALLLRTQVDLPAAGWSALLVLPASFIGVAIATALPQDAIRVVLAMFVLTLAWRPSALKAEVDDLRDERSKRRTLIGIGAASGVLNTTVGASGPVTSPFLKAVTATHTAFVATAAATQVIAHVSKLVAFSANGWSLSGHVDTIAVGAGGVVIGSLIGTRLLGRVSTRGLDATFKVVLTALAVRLLIVAVT